ncbi:hypothetical protein SVAN01_04676 [Stagonosporopsis vannaccii]|nr:hypothetical protein SVAN01_04676 [Stagonosporopsis vannaccii]
MAANAPYYQMRAGQLPTNNNPTAAAQTETIQDEAYGPKATTTTKQATEVQHLSLCPERAARQSGDGHHGDFEESHNLVELLEAATTAAGQEPMTNNAGETASTDLKIDGKRRRVIDVQTGVAAPIQHDESSVAKRRRIDTSSTDPNLNNNDIDTFMRSPASKSSPSPSRESLLVDARAAGVHSAAALFRRSTSNAGRKYTRPPMSKLFMSLNITPENFIALQALAKNYMLSPAHPERQSCVGNRGKGDTDMVKLRLFNCVRGFLADDGVGEQFFGEHVEKPGERESHEAAAALGEEGADVEKLVWPRDGNKIISLVTPLMRRMVTNERQRLYAIDTRKGSKKVEKDSHFDGHGHQSSPDSHAEQQLQTAFDPSLQRHTRSSPSAPPATTTKPHPLNVPTPSTPPSTLLSPPPSNVSLPPQAASPHLTNINIFLLYTSGSSKPIKLDEKRIATTRPAHLTFYNYTAFLEQVTAMVKRAEVLYPVVKAGGGSGPSAAVGRGGEIESETESLRGLAAAANALHDGDEQLSTSNTSAFVSSSGTAVDGAANYTVKTIGSNGWTVIDSAESWYHVLTERAFAIWADGVCNILVEMGAGSVMAGARREGNGVVMGDV